MPDGLDIGKFVFPLRVDGTIRSLGSGTTDHPSRPYPFPNRFRVPRLRRIRPIGYDTGYENLPSAAHASISAVSGSLPNLVRAGRTLGIVRPVRVVIGQMSHRTISRRAAKLGVMTGAEMYVEDLTWDEAGGRGR